MIVVYAAILESKSENKLGLLQTYKGLFQLVCACAYVSLRAHVCVCECARVCVCACDLPFLCNQSFFCILTYCLVLKQTVQDESLGELRTAEAFWDYLKDVSKNSRSLMPKSSAYFVEQTGYLKVWDKMQSFKHKVELSVQDLDPRIDGLSFSMVAWIQLVPGRRATIFEKALGSTVYEKGLVCWSWSVGGGDGDRFTYGAHDFSDDDLVNADSDARQVEIKAAKAGANDGQLHLVAVVVTESDISFYMDAQLLSTESIPRPVTDCKGNMLRVGDEGISKLGEITFYARIITLTEMQEKMFSGFTLQAISDGKLPFHPEATGLDVIKVEQKARFDESANHAQETDYELNIQHVISRASSQLAIEKEISKTHITVTPTLLRTLSVTPTTSIPSFLQQNNGEAVCRPVSFTGNNPPPCHIIQDDWQEQTDASGNKYFELLTPSMRGPGQSDKVFRFDPSTNKQWLNYNATK